MGAMGLEPVIKTVPPIMARAVGTTLQGIWKLLRLESEPPVTRWTAGQLSTAHWFDISAAKRDLGYEPRISITEGLELLRKHMSGGQS